MEIIHSIGLENLKNVEFEYSNFEVCLAYLIFIKKKKFPEKNG